MFRQTGRSKIRVKKLEANDPILVIYEDNCLDMDDAYWQDTEPQTTGLKKEEEQEEHLQQIITAKNKEFLFVPIPNATKEVDYYQDYYKKIGERAEQYVVERRNYDLLKESEKEYNATEKDIEKLDLSENELCLFEKMIEFLETKNSYEFFSCFSDAPEALKKKVFCLWQEKGCGEFIPKLCSSSYLTSKNDNYVCFVKRKQKDLRKTRGSEIQLIKVLSLFKQRMFFVRKISFLILKREQKKKKLLEKVLIMMEKTKDKKKHFSQFKRKEEVKEKKFFSFKRERELIEKKVLLDSKKCSELFIKEVDYDQELEILENKLHQYLLKQKKEFINKL